MQGWGMHCAFTSFALCGDGLGMGDVFNMAKARAKKKRGGEAQKEEYLVWLSGKRRSIPVAMPTVFSFFLCFFPSRSLSLVQRHWRVGAELAYL